MQSIQANVRMCSHAPSRMSSNGFRPDLAVIIDLVTPKTRVLDLGCGDGELLAKLVAVKQVAARGIELSEVSVRAAISKGLSVRQGNIEEGLADYPSHLFDFVILSQTIAFLNRPDRVTQDMLRVGKAAIISFDNAGYIGARLRLLRGAGFGPPITRGAPGARALPLRQFDQFASDIGAVVEQRVLVRNSRRVRYWPDVLAQTAVYVLRPASA